MEQNKLGAIHKEGKNMRYITKIYSTAIMMMAAVIIACSGGSETIEDVKPVTPDTPKTLNKYTFTVNASKSAGKSNTRALSLDGNTLNSSWATSEHIYVKKDPLGQQALSSLKATKPTHSYLAHCLTLRSMLVMT